MDHGYKPYTKLPASDAYLSVGAVSLLAFATLEQVSWCASTRAYLCLSDSLLGDCLTQLLQLFTSHLLRAVDQGEKQWNTEEEHFLPCTHRQMVWHHSHQFSWQPLWRVATVHWWQPVWTMGSWGLRGWTLDSSPGSCTSCQCLCTHWIYVSIGQGDSARRTNVFIKTQ